MTAQPVIPPELSKHFQSGSWIWLHQTQPAPGSSVHITNSPTEIVTFRKWYNATEATLVSALVLITADNQFTLFANGKFVGSGGNWKRAQLFNVTLKPKDNIFTVQCVNNPSNDAMNPAGLLVSIMVYTSDGKNSIFGSDVSWRTNGTFPQSKDVALPSLDDTAWIPAVLEGNYGSTPWNKSVVLPTQLSLGQQSPDPLLSTMSFYTTSQARSPYVSHISIDLYGLVIFSLYAFTWLPLLVTFILSLSLNHSDNDS